MTNIIVVDPIIFTSPPETATRNEVENHLYALQQWTKHLTQRPTAFYTTEKCVSGLYDAGLGPTEEGLRTIIHRHNIDVFDAATLMKSVQRLVSHQPYLEDKLGVNDVVVDASRCRVEPDEIISRMHTALRTPFYQTAAMLCLSPNLWENAGFATLAMSDPSDTVEASVFVDMAAFQGGDVTEYGDAFSLVMDLYAGGLPDDGGSRSIAGTWEEHPEVALALAFDQMVRPASPETKLGTFRFHPEFVPSLKRLRIETQPSILRATFRKAAMIASGTGLTSQGLELHWIEEPKDGPQKMRTRDGAKAWRCQVQQRGIGYQLHYWDCGDSVEFAVVVPHSEVHIPD